MNNVIKILIVIPALLLLALGLKSMFLPMEMAEKFGVEPLGPNGLNTIRGHLGGTLLTAAALMFIGLLSKNTTWFLATAVFMGLVAVGRAVGFAVDGIAPEAIPPLVIEIIIIGVMMAAHKKLK